MMKEMCKKIGRLFFEFLFVKEPAAILDAADENDRNYINCIDRTIYVVISSVIYYKVSDGRERSKISFEDRLEQTLHTIESIRQAIPQAKVFFVEGGTVDVAESIEKYVDYYLYLGKVKRIESAVSHKNKGMGEAAMLVEAYKQISDADFIFKISGRYFLNEHFCIDKIDFDRLNFVNYSRNGKAAFGKWTWIEGSHSTRLLGFPDKYRNEMIRALRLSKIGLCQGVSLESVLPFWLRKLEFHYISEIGVSGQSGNSIGKELYSE